MLDREIATEAQDLPHPFAYRARHRAVESENRCHLCGYTRNGTPLHESGLADQVREQANYTTLTTQKGS